MRTLMQKYLGGLAVDEDTYKVDLAVLERYQAFSSELLRLSLLGIAGYGFLLANVVFKVAENGQYLFLGRLAGNKHLLAVGAVALGVSAAAALGHRYFSTDCLAHFVRRLRLSSNLESLPATNRQAVESTIRHEEESLNADLNMCRWFLIVACLALFVGVAAVAWVFAATLFN